MLMILYIHIPECSNIQKCSNKNTDDVDDDNEDGDGDDYMILMKTMKIMMMMKIMMKIRNNLIIVKFHFSVRSSKQKI